MKKTIICLMAALILCSVLASCALKPININGSESNTNSSKIENDVKNNGSVKTLVEKMNIRYTNFSTADRSRIETKINDAKGHTFSFSYFDGPDGYVPDYSSTSYGKFSGCSVWVILGQAQVIDVQEVDGKKFIFSSSFNIFVEKYGEICDLKDAFEKGFLTNDDIAEIYEIHKEFVVQYYDGEDLYKESE